MYFPHGGAKVVRHTHIVVASPQRCSSNDSYSVFMGYKGMSHNVTWWSGNMWLQDSCHWEL